MMATATKQRTSASSPSREQQQPSSRTTLAIASDPEKALHLSPNFQPDVDLLTAEGVIAFGVKGSGKSNLLALIVEQLRRFFLPQLILDIEREYQSLLPLLPHGMIATAQRCPSGHDILQYGLQVIMDLQSWDSDEAAARAMCQLVDELFAATHAIAPQDRFSCVIHLDEAGYWLPQDAVSYLSKGTRKALADAFHKLATRGRKQGLSPFLYTQSISEIEKSVIRQAGVKILMRQTLDIDLTRYCQYLHGATAQTRRAIQAFPKGRAIVVLPDGSQHKFQFYERESEHTSHTPQAQTALVKFATMNLDVEALTLRDMTSTTTTTEISGASMPQSSRTATPSSRKALTSTERVDALLAENPALPTAEVVAQVGCSATLVRRRRKAYLALHPEQREEISPPGAQTVSARLQALLAENPSLSAGKLADLVGCSRRHATDARSAYFAQHPERKVTPPKAPTMSDDIAALLAENPTLSTTEIIARTGCSKSLVRDVRRKYFAQHPEQKAVIEQHARSARQQRAQGTEI